MQPSLFLPNFEKAIYSVSLTNISRVTVSPRHLIPHFDTYAGLFAEFAWEQHLQPVWLLEQNANTSKADGKKYVVSFFFFSIYFL